MSEVVVFFADGMEEVEALTVVDLLRRAKIETRTISVMGRENVVGSHKIEIMADITMAEANFKDVRMLVLPGGRIGTKNLSEHSGVRDLIQTFHREGKYVAAICAASTILGEMGLLKEKKAICYPGMEEKLGDAEVIAENAVCDGNVVTGRALGGAIDFALKLIEVLRDKNTAEKIAQEIVYNH